MTPQDSEQDQTQQAVADAAALVGSDPPAPEAPAAQPDQPEAPSLELPFRLEDIEDPQHRQFLQTRQAQMQAAFTRKTMEVAEERQRVQDLVQLQEALSDPTTRDAAIADFVKQYGYDFELGDDEDPDLPEDAPLVDPEVAELRERIAAQEAESAARTRAEREAQWDAHVSSNLQAFAQQQGVEELPEVVVNDILTKAIAAPRLPNGLLNFDQAIAEHLQVREFISQQEREAYLASKDVPGVTVSGGHGEPVRKLVTKADRLKAGEAIAARHY